MSLLNIFNNQLSEVIEWKSQDPSVLWFKYPNQRDEIINASKLIVSPGQGCILVYEGKVANLLTDEGIYNLKTDNHPFITTLSRIRQNFTSEHKVFIYFFRKADVLNQFWGTASPIKYMDPAYKIPVELGANGVFSYHLANPSFFYQSIVANKDFFTADDMKEIIVNKIPQNIVSLLAERKYSYVEVDSKLSELGDALQTLLNKDFESIGVQLLEFKINGTQFDEKTRERIGSIADITSEATAAKAADLSFADLEKLRALRDAARNQGGIAGIGAQLGAGMQIGSLFNTQKTESAAGAANAADGDFAAKLQKLNSLLKDQLITEDEYNELKKQILSKI